jgi:hypothetical protein
MTAEQDGHPDGTTEELLPWPPPGLARIQGDLWLVVRKLAVTGAVLVVPLLCVLTIPQAESGLGPLGDAWWAIILTTLAGVGLLVDALVALVRLLRRVRLAAAEGYSGRVIGLVVSDRTRDAGFLLQGAHAFSSLSPEVRTALARMRLLAGIGHLLASGWFVLGFGVLVVLATRGRLSPEGLLVWTVVPTTILGVGGLILRATEGSLVGRARREWHRHPWAQDLVLQEIGAWKAGAEARGVDTGGRIVRPVVVKSVTAVVIVAGLLSFMPSVTLVPVSSMGVILTSMAGWNYTSTRVHAAHAEAFRNQIVEPDSMISALEAGEILNTLSYVGRSDEDFDEPLADPVHRYETSWFPVETPAVWAAHIPPTWSDSVWTQADDGLSVEQLAYLREVAAHPAHAELSRLARASELDQIGGAFDLPFEPDAVFFELPIPHSSALRAGADAHFATAALHSVEGRHDEAIRLTREVISVGLLLMDESPHLIGNLIGSRLVEAGGRALRQALRRSGDTSALAALDGAVGAAERATASAFSGRPAHRPGGQDFLAAARELALDPEGVRGLRWESAHITAVVTPCLNMHNIVFGPGLAYERWLAEVRAGLVRYEAEADYFEVAARGLDLGGAGAGRLSRLLTFAMGGGEAPSSCARVITTLGTMM